MVAGHINRILGGRPTWRGLFDSAVFIALTAAVIGLFDSLGWPWELPSHFRPQLAAVLAVASAISLLVRAWKRAAFIAIVALSQGWLGASLWSPALSQPQPATNAPAFRLCSYNVHTENHDFASTISFLRDGPFDAVILMEVDDRWMAALAALRPDYPFVLAEPRNDNFGIALLSRQTPDHSAIVWHGEASVPSVQAGFGWLHLLGTHPLPPGSRSMAALRDAQLADIAGRVLAKPHTVVAGDLNCTPWSAPFRHFASKSGLCDTSQGNGWQATWPAFAPSPFRIPIDHALMSTDIVCVGRSIGPDLGSDHRPLLLTFLPAK